MRRLISTLGRHAPKILAIVCIVSMSQCSGSCESEPGDPGAPPAPIPSNSNFYTCECTCPGAVTGPVFPCVPPELNANTGGALPSLADLMTDCTTRVEPAIEALTAQCVTGTPTDCTCVASASLPPGVNPSCDPNCPAEPLAADCSNQKTATTIGGVPGTLCRLQGVDPPVPTPEGLFGGLFMRGTQGVITSAQAVIHVDGEDDRNVSASGTVRFGGGPCPGASCTIDASFDVTSPDAVEYCGLGGFGKLRIEGISANGASLPQIATLAGSGAGTFAPETVQAVGMRTVREFGCVVACEGCFETGSNTQAFLATNFKPVNVIVDWAGKAFDVSGKLSAKQDGTAFSIDLHAQGVLANQPPAADAGPDQLGDDAVECTSPAGAEITLNAGGSTDPDDNIAWYVWRRGLDVTGDLVGSTQIVHLVQPVGTTRSYHLKLADAFAQVSDDTTVVGVVDTTAPVIGTVTLARDCLWPPNHNYVRFALGKDVIVEVSDICDPSPLVAIQSVTSSQPDDAIGNGDGATTGDVLVGPGGFCVRSERGAVGGAGRTYRVTIAAMDDFGNTSTKDVEIRVPHAGNVGCPHIPAEEFVLEEEAAAACSFPSPIGGP